MTSAKILALIFAAAASSACSSTTTSGGGGADAGNDGARGTGKIGDPCPGGQNDCAAGFDCAGEDPGGGQCYKQCAPSKDSDCGDVAKYACSSEGHCYLRCNATTDCPRASQGYVCKDDKPARGVKFCDVP